MSKSMEAVMDVDWGPIDAMCHARSVSLEEHDGKVRPAFDIVGQLLHKDNCWLGKNYAEQPDVKEIRARGCDMGCIKEAAERRRKLS